MIRAAPKLKDVALNESKARELYLQCIQLMRTMYHKSQLIHADLSEFNMLLVVLLLILIAIHNGLK
jgi:RIO kinase 1